MGLTRLFINIRIQSNMFFLLIIIAFTTSVLLSWLIIPRILVVAFRKRLFDMPDARKIHSQAIPRLGGLSFVPTIFFSLSLTLGLQYTAGSILPPGLVQYIVPEFCFLVCGLVLLYLSGIKDDLVGLRYRTKFLVQIIAALFFPLSGLWINNLYGLFGIHELSAWIGIPFTILGVVFITNAINLIDGIDGLASGLSSVVLGVLGSLFLYEHLWLYATLAFSTLGVLLPFFYYNVFGQAEHCKKIFMGDTGSLTLGYILSFLSIRYASYNPVVTPYADGAIVIAFSTLIVPLFDVVRVMLVRARNHKGLFSPDKNHIHHKFLAMGFSPRAAMLSILALACVFSCMNILLITYIDNTVMFMADIVLWTGLNLLFDRIRDRSGKTRKDTRIGKKA